MKDTLSLQAHLLLQATKQIAPNPAMSRIMLGFTLRRWRVEKSIPDHFVHHCADHVCVASMIILLFISLIHER